LIADYQCSALDDLDEYGDLKPALLSAATSLLWNWTGRVFGLSEVTVRPCRTDCAPSTYHGIAGIPSSYRTGPFLPILINGEFYNVRCGRKCKDDDRSMAEIGLPGPVDTVLQVRVDGEVLPASAYRVDNRVWLVRTDGDTWPVCQDLTAEPTEPNTFEVTYLWGAPVPDGGRLAATVLACEMAKATLGRDCSLPQRVQSVSREGVSIAVLDTFEGLEAGRTGIWVVDSWVTSVMNAPRKARVLSPDTRTARVAT
jgi:hypothetical protein